MDAYQLPINCMSDFGKPGSNPGLHIPKYLKNKLV